MATAEHTPTFELEVMQQCCMTCYVIPYSRIQVCALHILSNVYNRRLTYDIKDKDALYLNEQQARSEGTPPTFNLQYCMEKGG